jgi:hypothetical protein
MRGEGHRGMARRLSAMAASTRRRCRAAAAWLSPWWRQVKLLAGEHHSLIDGQDHSQIWAHNQDLLIEISRPK